MKLIKNQEFGGERPLYASHDLRLEGVTIHLGESSIKESSNIEAENCRFEGKYVFWENDGFRINNCYFAESAAIGSIPYRGVSCIYLPKIELSTSLPWHKISNVFGFLWNTKMVNLLAIDCQIHIWIMTISKVMQFLVHTLLWDLSFSSPENYKIFYQ